MRRKNIKRIDKVLLAKLMESLPDELILRVLQSLDEGDTPHVAALGQITNSIWLYDPTLWHKRFKNHFPNKYGMIELQLRQKLQAMNISTSAAEFENNVLKLQAMCKWVKLFKYCQTTVYANLPDNLKSVFYLIKDNRPADAIHAGFSFNQIMLEDEDHQSLVKLAEQSANPLLWNYIFQRAEDFYLNNLDVDPEGNTLLHWAVRCHQPEQVVLRLIREGHHADATNTAGESILFTAIAAKHPAVIPALVRNQVNLEEVNAMGHTPLQQTVFESTDADVETARILLQQGANVEAENQSLNGRGYPALFLAVKNQAMLRLLLDEGRANILRTDARMNTILHCAVVHFSFSSPIEKKEIVKNILYLIARGARADDVNADGRSAIQYAAEVAGQDLAAVMRAKVESLNRDPRNEFNKRPGN